MLVAQEGWLEVLGAAPARRLPNSPIGTSVLLLLLLLLLLLRCCLHMWPPAATCSNTLPVTRPLLLLYIHQKAVQHLTSLYQASTTCFQLP
jgi:hypothetical protein